MTDVLVLRALGLGDLLASVAALRGLRRAWPGARLVLAAPAALGGWLQSLGLVDDVADLRGLDDAAGLAALAASPEVVVNLHGQGPESHRLARRLRPARLVGFACRAAGFDDGPAWCDDEHEVDRWIRLSHWVGGVAEFDDLRLPPPGERRDHVVVHPGAASGSRRWPARRWAEVAAALAAEGHRVVVTGTPAEADPCAQVAASAAGIEDHCGRHDLAALGDLVGTASLLVSGDTGVAHVATAFGTPSVTLFGPVAPALWGPRIDPHLHRPLWHGTGPQLRPGDPHGTDPDERLLAIGVPEVVDAAHEVLPVRTSP
ncbi:MAG: glycosyltransferase family 9 protein [Ornithinibacter sp.]